MTKKCSKFLEYEYIINRVSSKLKGAIIVYYYWLDQSNKKGRITYVYNFYPPGCTSVDKARAWG